MWGRNEVFYGSPWKDAYRKVVPGVILKDRGHMSWIMKEARVKANKGRTENR